MDVGGSYEIRMVDIMIYYMTNSRGRGISQSAFENPGPYILIRADISSQQNYNGPNVFIENKAVKDRRKM